MGDNAETDLPADSIDAIHYKGMEVIKDLPPGKALDFPSGHGRFSARLKAKEFGDVVD